MIKYNLRRVRLKPVVWLSVIFILACSINAWAMQVVQVEPAKVRQSISPGANRTGTLKVYNNSKDPKYIKVYVEDWVYFPACDGTKEFKPAGSTELSAASWINFSPGDFTIPAYGLQVINFAAKVPPEAQGGHYAVLFFENSSGKKIALEGVAVSVNVRVGALFYLEPAGTIERSAKIEDFKVSKKEDKFYIEARFSNTGNVDMTTKGSFYIMDGKGLVRARGGFNDLYTFPGNSATLAAYWKEMLPKGSYSLIMSIDTGKALEDTGMGRGPVITKEAELEIGEDGGIVSAGDLK